MTSVEYQKIKRVLRATADSIETSKRPAYTIGSEDVLANFKRVAASSGMTPAQCALVYMLKHVDSISSYVTNPNLLQAEPLIERFADLDNYGNLLLALLVEQDDVRIKDITTEEEEENDE